MISQTPENAFVVELWKNPLKDITELVITHSASKDHMFMNIDWITTAIKNSEENEKGTK